MAKFKVYYTIELNEIATHIFESNDFEVKLCSHNDEETYVKELAAFQPDAIMCRTEPMLTASSAAATSSSAWTWSTPTSWAARPSA